MTRSKVLRRRFSFLPWERHVCHMSTIVLDREATMEFLALYWRSEAEALNVPWPISRQCKHRGTSIRWLLLAITATSGGVFKSQTILNISLLEIKTQLHNKCVEHYLECSPDHCSSCHRPTSPRSSLLSQVYMRLVPHHLFPCSRSSYHPR